MRVLILFLIVFMLIIISIVNNISVLYPLICGLLIFAANAFYMGFKIKDIWTMILKGIKKSSIIYSMFALIGAIISVWISCGTVQGLMYYGFSLIKPQYFIVISFLLTASISMLLGTAFGTVSTIGVVLMSVGRGFGISPAVISGAIISGAYLGDRSSPMSSSAMLTSTISESKLYDNLRYMVYTLMPAFLISLILYFFAGNFVHLNSYDLTKVIEIQNAIKNNFNVSPLIFIPPLMVMILPLFKINVKTNMLIGIVSGSIIAMLFQNVSVIQLIRYAILGYNKHFSNPFLSSIIKGGGVISMVKAGLIIAVSSAINGIIEDTGMMDRVLFSFANNIKSIGELVLKTVGVSIVTAMYGCSQTLSIMLTGYIIKPVFKKYKLSNVSLARTIADTCAVISPIIPWNIAGLVPALNMGVKATDFIPYSFLCFLLPVTTICYAYFGFIRKEESEKTEAA